MQTPATTERLLVFARPPILGRVKRRLAAQLGDRLALRLYRAFLVDTLALAHRAAADGRSVEICFGSAWQPDAAIGAALGSLPTTPQGEGDLGQRLLRAFSQSRRRGERSCVVIGTDSPTLPDTTVQQAFRRLADGSPATLAPASDGGYVLLGLAGGTPPRLETFFSGIPWGTSDVARRTLEQASAAGQSVAMLVEGFDVDDLDGLTRLRQELADPDIAARAPATYALLRDLDLGT
ncbi:TIGR04282 family arsenosugar biosynthesis glycosyltransferase [bacterium]|nr:TIGR04282 family arsenosugar biosynthesis glycosyltransferase [bacterium]